MDAPFASYSMAELEARDRRAENLLRTQHHNSSGCVCFDRVMCDAALDLSWEVDEIRLEFDRRKQALSALVEVEEFHQLLLDAEAEVARLRVLRDDAIRSAVDLGVDSHEIADNLDLPATQMRRIVDCR